MAFIKVLTVAFDGTEAPVYINEDHIYAAVPVPVDERGVVCRLMMPNGIMIPVKTLPAERREWGRAE